jgi:TPR repeat protein
MKKFFVLFFLIWGSFSFADSGESYLKQAIKSYKKGDYTTSINLFKKACDMNNADGCYHLGMIFVYAQKIKQHYTTAAVFLKKACDLSNANGCYAL